ncbi:hypothetical protein [Modestobacter sp. I12A-02662]|uniref:hypothetical protein n=1 Tax=Modestobacter sp. I12A-02662 TaxID=1730496 RepID=UPI0034DE1F65
MNVVTGRIVVKDSGVGVPDLLVVLNDVDAGTKAEEPLPSVEGGASGPAERAASSLARGADRLGSVLTGPDGRFSITYDDADFRIRNEEKRPDLQLVVLAPEEPGLAYDDRVLYASPAVRQNSARTESYLVRLGADLLGAAGIAVPSGATFLAEPTGGVARRLEAIETWQSGVVDASIAAAAVRADRHKQRFAHFSDDLRPRLAGRLSSVPASGHDSDRFVTADESVADKSHAVMARNITGIVNEPGVRRPVRGILTLSAAEVEALRARVDESGFVTADALADVTGHRAAGSFVQRPDAATFCPAGTGLGATTPLGTNTTPQPHRPHVAGENVEPSTDADVPRFLARVMGTMSPPEEQAETGLMVSASRTTVEASVGSFALRPSPADVPAFRDYTQLQIAFQHVWQEAVDEGVLNLAEDAYQAIVELGGSPEGITGTGQDLVGGLLAEGRMVLAAGRVVRDHRGDKPAQPPSGAPGGVVVSGSGSEPSAGRDHRRQSNTPVVRDHRTGNAPVVRDHRTGTTTGTSTGDPVDRLPGLLLELQKRLRGTYAFTVFAANRRERSVNFGLLNTYRQVWRPLSYQAGPLVKSIPLAPRQTQKLTVTRKVHRKRSQRELANNLRVVREELSDTSRAEEEIARRASAKTTFSMSNSVSGSVDVFSGTHTNAFTREAGKTSDDIRKSLHENTFKVAQEVKAERTTEVNTEESEDFETTEVTEISNPNDEIAVTFLLYELQRRFRVRERLHRVRPVVLVAQEVPAPHDIDIDWLVVHDWILKRAVLDDSFLPALAVLTRTAGEETAVAELKVNVDQQRAIVDELREEVVAARRNAEAQNALLERAVYRRAVPSDGGGGGGGLFGFVGDIAEEVADLGADVLGGVGDLVFGGDADQTANNRQAMQDAAQRAADQARDLLFRLEREVTALNALMESYAKAVREHYDHLTEIARLQVHVKENILYYMQAVWTYEPPDQRFFRLHTVPVPVFTSTRRAFRIEFDDPVPGMFTPPHTSLPRFGGLDVRGFPFEADTAVDPEPASAPLSEVADLDTLLGFKGNYMVFPLLESNALTDFMMDPYVDRATGELMDPTDPDVMTADEFTDYVECLQEAVTEEELEGLRADLAEHEQALTPPGGMDDVLVVPSESLFIEALPATETMLEPYKKVHRFEDAKKVQEEVRAMQLESIRRMARLLAGEREDPNVDKRVLIQGETGPVVVDEP